VCRSAIGARGLAFGDGSEQVQSDSLVAVACNDVREINIYTAGGKDILNSRKGLQSCVARFGALGYVEQKLARLRTGSQK
jgi:hypothetical protein